GRLIWVAKYGPDAIPRPYGPPIWGERGLVSTVFYTYDNIDRPLSVTKWTPDQATYTTQVTTTYRYDDEQNQVIVTDPKGTRTFTRDGAGRLIKTVEYDGSTSTTVYANNGATATTTTQT